jgi:hypothetical protein
MDLTDEVTTRLKEMEPLGDLNWSEELGMLVGVDSNTADLAILSCVALDDVILFSNDI